MHLKILLAGDGGQGVQTMADIIGRAAFQNNFHISLIPNYGLEQRGGVSLVFLQIADQKIAYPKFSQPDMLIILSEQARERIGQYQKEGAEIFDFQSFKSFFEKEKILPARFNVFFLGVLSKILEDKKICRAGEILDLLEKKLGQKLGWEDNQRIFRAGLNY
ncbi:MAG: 2-oxoacid:acceptor oxidoreductase family protein [Candidatus Magasanikbacteria bacterium]|nr:2-oxoacid:acceptor oxidoreductase family protein [Candidatus Magasanikbacteria bacterium]